MKITIFGLTLSSSWGNGHATPYRAILRALHRRGCAVTFYEKDLPYYAARRDFSSCNFCRLKLYANWDEIRSEALAEAAESDVAMVASYCPVGARISDDVLNLAGPMRVFYDLDTPITLKNLAAGPLDYLRRDQIPEFDLYLSFTGGKILQSLEDFWGARQARPLYGCVDPAVHMRVSQRVEFRSDFSYMGTYAPDRQEKLNKLFLEPSRRLPQRNFLLAGSLYPGNWVWGHNVRRVDHVTSAEHPAFYSSSRCTLNITREEMARAGYCPSGRFFEAAACGAPIVSDWWQGLDEFFQPEKEILVANRADDVIAAMSLPDEELKRIALCARQRTLDEHTGEQRAEQLLNYFKDSYAPPPRSVSSTEYRVLSN